MLVAPVAVWWYRFDTSSALPELATGVALCAVLFLVSTVVLSAALLSFSIYELKRVPAIHAKPRGVPMAVAAVVLIAMLFVPAYADRDRVTPEPMVVTTQTTARVALIAVDGLTYEILQSRPDLLRAVPHVARVSTLPGDSTAERWASLGTGVRTDAHGVRAIEGVRFRGATHLLQRISRGGLRADARRAGIGDRAARAAAADGAAPRLRVGDRRGARDPGGVGELVGHRGRAHGRAPGGRPGVGLYLGQRRRAARRRHGQRALPGSAGAAAAVRDGVPARAGRGPQPAAARPVDAARTVPARPGRADEHVAQVRARGYEVVLSGLPGDGQSGAAVVAWTLPVQRATTQLDIAPTLLELLGFPLSNEMPGRSLLSERSEPRIATYGNRTSAAPPVVNEEYYENLKSLGYIR